VLAYNFASAYIFIVFLNGRVAAFDFQLKIKKKKKKKKGE
jgi:hypothetical protein